MKVLDDDEQSPMKSGSFDKFTANNVVGVRKSKNNRI